MMFFELSKGAGAIAGSCSTKVAAPKLRAQVSGKAMYLVPLSSRLQPGERDRLHSY